MNIDKKNQLYLGKYKNTETQKFEEPFFINSSDLTTHSICIGMTGSGKTGLCIDLLEELALNGVPILVIDPKGDLCNLALQFPDCAPGDFLPFIDEYQAQQNSMTRKAYAEFISNKWKAGLQEWGIIRNRIQSIKEQSDLRIFTPGSSAGTSLNMLSSLNKDPELDFDTDSETIFEKIKGLSLALLNLIGFEDIQITDKEYLLLVNIFEWAWRNNEVLDLIKIIRLIMEPPFFELGVIPLETVFPKNARQEFAVKINSLIANPAFKIWLEGVPMEIEKLLYSPSGKPSLSIVYTAHLKQHERMFVTTLLLYNLVSWMFHQPGTGQLRAYLYFDEVFGYIPPYPKNPPTKEPILTLMKQGRAFGVGIHLTSQNPKDIDYKAFTNSGIWMIGKLQTENDKERLLDGLRGEGNLNENDNKLFSRMITELQKREFLIKNVHTDKIELVRSRWAISYLKGPFTLKDIKHLKTSETEPVKENVIEHKTGVKKAKANLVNIKPELPKEIREEFLDRVPESSDISDIYYYPYVYFNAKVLYDSKAPSIHLVKNYTVQVDASDSSDFNSFYILDDYNIKGKSESSNFLFNPVSENFRVKGFVNSIKSSAMLEVINQKGLKLFKNKFLKMTSNPGESKEEFTKRIDMEIDNKVEDEIEKIKSKYSDKLEKLQEKLKKKSIELSSDKETLEDKKREEGFNALESVFSVLSGRKRRSVLSQASRKRRMTKSAEAEVKKTKGEIDTITSQINKLKNELEDKVAEIDDKFEEQGKFLEEFEIKPRKSNILIEDIFLLWTPTKEMSKE